MFENKFFEYFTLKPLFSAISFALFSSSILSPIIGLEGATTPIVSPIFNLAGKIFVTLIFSPFVYKHVSSIILYFYKSEINAVFNP